MRQTLIVRIILSLTAIFAFTGISTTIADAATAQPGTAQHCISLYAPVSRTPSSATAEWTQNAAVHHGCGYTGREHIHCVPNGGGSYQNAYGGKVVAEQLPDRANCPAAAPNLVKAGWQEYLPGGAKTFWYYTGNALRGPPAHTTVMIVRDHQARRCTLSYTITQNTANIFEVKFSQTCGISWRAYRFYGGGDKDLGTYRKCPGCTSPYSTVCDITSCQGHPDGAPGEAGIQRKDTGADHCLVDCPSAQAPPIALTAFTSQQRSCHVGSLSWAGGPSTGPPFTRYSTVLNTEDSPSGCEQVLTRVLSTGGHTYRSGLIRHVLTATAFVKDGTTVAKAWTEKQPYNKPQDRVCKQDYPTDEVNYHSCTG